MRHHKKGMSVVISTVILTSVLLTITTAAMMFSNSLMKSEFDANEYEQAKNMLITLSKAIDDAVASPLTAHYVHFNVRTSQPMFVSDSHTITLTVSTYGTLFQGNTSMLKVKGGSQVGAVRTGIQGDGSMVVTDPDVSLSHIYEYQSNGAWITLDYARVRVTWLGCQYYYDDGSGASGYFNIVRVAFVNLVISTTTGTDALNIIVRSSPSSQSQILSGVINPIISLTVDDTTAQTTVHGAYIINSQYVVGTILQFVNTNVVVSSQ